MSYLACLDDPLPATPAECVLLSFVEAPAGFLPPLSIPDAASILVAVCGVLAIAWVYKQLRRVAP